MKTLIRLSSLIRVFTVLSVLSLLILIFLRYTALLRERIILTWFLMGLKILAVFWNFVVIVSETDNAVRKYHTFLVLWS